MSSVLDGIGGINVTTLVAQLMAIESKPQALLKTQQTKVNGVLAAFQSLSGTFTSLQTAAEAMVGTTGTTPWVLYAATSSSTNVSAAATASAVPGIYNFNVTAVAAAHSMLYSGQMAQTATAATGTSITITQGGVPTTVSFTDTTLVGVVKAINATPGLGVKAAAIQTGVGLYQLQLNATATGAASQFTVTGLSAAVGTGTVLTTGASASVQIGTSSITSSTNTFSTVFPGVTFTVSKVENGDTITVANNVAGMSTQVQTLVTAMNTALGMIASQTSYDATLKKAGPLLGEPLPRQLQANLQQAVLTLPGGATLATIGIQVDKTGNLTFDSAKFATAMATDPSGTQALVTGFAQRVNTVATDAVKATTGSITTAIMGKQAAVKDLTDSIATWDLRLAQRQADLQRQYSQLATTLARMKDQQSWLAGQFLSLSQ